MKRSKRAALERRRFKERAYADLVRHACQENADFAFECAVLGLDLIRRRYPLNVLVMKLRPWAWGNVASRQVAVTCVGGGGGGSANPLHITVGGSGAAGRRGGFP